MLSTEVFCAVLVTVMATTFLTPPALEALFARRAVEPASGEAA